MCHTHYVSHLIAGCTCAFFLSYCHVAVRVWKPEPTNTHTTHAYTKLIRPCCLITLYCPKWPRPSTNYQHHSRPPSNLSFCCAAAAVMIEHARLSGVFAHAPLHNKRTPASVMCMYALINCPPLSLLSLAPPVHSLSVAYRDGVQSALVMSLLPFVFVSPGNILQIKQARKHARRRRRPHR